MNRMIILTAVTILIATGCTKDKIDNTPPVIDTNYSTFPIQCSEIKRGERFTFKARFTDDDELGSYGLDIHNNFDHHNHSTEVGECNPDPIKAPINPYVLLKNNEIPAGKKTYDANLSIDVPDDIDSGDYHFIIKVTDKAGWQSIKGLSVKIIP